MEHRLNFKAWSQFFKILKETVNMEADKQLTILHFNDVYDISEDDNHLCGGVARFAAALQNHKK